MNDKVTTAQALQMIATALEESLENIRPEVLLKDLNGWDSMGVLLVMAELDERFGIFVEEDKIESFEHVSDLLAILAAENVLADS